MVRRIAKPVKFCKNASRVSSFPNAKCANSNIVEDIRLDFTLFCFGSTVTISMDSPDRQVYPQLRTTRLYNRRSDEVSLDEVERILIWSYDRSPSAK